MFDRIHNRREEEEKLKKEDLLPPGQALTQKFPILHYGHIPQFDPATWDFRIWGEVENEIRWTWDDLLQLPRTKRVMDIHCVTRWSKFDTTWDGISPRELVDKGVIKVKPTAKFVIQYAEYGYSTNLPIEILLAENFLLATHFNGEPLSPEHGFPLRGVVGYIRHRDDLFTPYFWKGAKWLRGLEFLSEDKPGFWEKAGYHNDADVWKEQRFV